MTIGPVCVCVCTCAYVCRGSGGCVRTEGGGSNSFIILHSQEQDNKLG